MNLFSNCICQLTQPVYNACSAAVLSFKQTVRKFVVQTVDNGQSLKSTEVRNANAETRLNGGDKAKIVGNRPGKEHLCGCTVPFRIPWSHGERFNNEARWRRMIFRIEKSWRQPSARQRKTSNVGGCRVWNARVRTVPLMPERNVVWKVFIIESEDDFITSPPFQKRHCVPM